MLPRPGPSWLQFLTHRGLVDEADAGDAVELYHALFRGMMGHGVVGPLQLRCTSGLMQMLLWILQRKLMSRFLALLRLGYVNIWG